MAQQGKSAAPASSRLFGDYLIMLITPCIMAWYYNGDRAVRVMLACVAATLLSDIFGGIIFTDKSDIKSPDAIFTGLAIALMLPAAVPYYVPVLAGMFAVFAVKLPFGSALNSPFVPAAAGFAFASICFREEVFTYVSRSVTGADKFLGGISLGSVLNTGESLKLNLVSGFDIATGNIAGPMGTTCAVVMLGCSVLLFFRRPKALYVTTGFLLGASIIALIAPRASVLPITSLYLEICSGSLLFAAVFLATDPATMPSNNLFRLLYGVYMGVLCMAVRHFGIYEEGVCFAILLANATWPIMHGLLTDIKTFLVASKRSKAKGAVKQ